MLATWHGYWGEWELQSKLTFDGPAKLIIVNPGVTALDIRTELYTDAIDWLSIRDNSMFLPPIRFTGLDLIPGGTTGDSYFLINGWRLVIDLAKVKVTGVLFSDDYTSAYFNDALEPVFPATVSALVNNASAGEVTATVDIDAIATEVASRFAEPSMTTAGIAAATSTEIGEIDAGINEVQLNRAIQAAIPAPPSDAAIAKELKRILDKPVDYSKPLKAIEQRLQKLAKPAPKSNDAAEIKQMLRMVLSQVEPTNNRELLEQIKDLYRAIDALPKDLPEIPDNTAQIDDIQKQIDVVISEVLENRDVVIEEIQAIEKPDLSQIVTKDELAAVSSILSKLQNYDDASVISMLKALREDSGAIQNSQDIHDQKLDLMLDNQIGI